MGYNVASLDYDYSKTNMDFLSVAGFVSLFSIQIPFLSICQSHWPYIAITPSSSHTPPVAQVDLVHAAQHGASQRQLVGSGLLELGDSLQVHFGTFIHQSTWT